MINDDERIALFLDYENLAIGARDGLGVSPFAFGPIADALAERGRVVARRAYADWSYFGDDRRLLALAQVELIEIPQRLGAGAGRKNAADIKMAVDAVEMAYERGFVTTFAIGTGDSDFTPLVHKLREMDKRVIGIGVQSSTSALLPPACDEFLFYDRLPGVEARPVPRKARTRGRHATAAPEPAATPTAEPAAAGRVAAGPVPTPVFAEPAAADRAADRAAEDRAVDEVVDDPTADVAPADERDVAALVVQTLAGLQRHADGPVLASRLKRAILRKDPTFDEADHGFRGFGELLRNLESQRIVELRQGGAQGDPQVSFPEDASAEGDAFRLLAEVVGDLQSGSVGPQLSGLKDQLRKRVPDFSEKRYGFNSFLSFTKAARARGLVEMEWDDEVGDYLLHVPD